MHLTRQHGTYKLILNTALFSFCFMFHREEAKHPKMAKIRENTDNGDGYFSPEERKSIKRRKSVGGIKIRPGENLHVQLQGQFPLLRSKAK